jgi:hypothetical protein
VRIALLICLALGGCSLSLLPSRARQGARLAPVRLDDTTCSHIDNAVIGWTATATAMGALGGAGGVSNLFTADTSRYIVGGVSVGVSTFGAIAAYLSTAYAQKYVRSCTTSSP